MMNYWFIACVIVRYNLRTLFFRFLLFIFLLRSFFLARSHIGVHTNIRALCKSFFVAFQNDPSATDGFADGEGAAQGVLAIGRNGNSAAGIIAAESFAARKVIV